MTQHTSHFLLILLFIVACQCSHFRGGTIAWSVPNEQPNTVLFSITTYWKPGSEVPTFISLNLGDGTINKYSLEPTTSNSDFVTATGVAQYTYKTAGRYIAFIADCCRVEGLRAGSTSATVVSRTTTNSVPWRIATTVQVGNVADVSPVLTIPPVIDFGIGSNTFPIVTSIPASSFQFSLGTESGLLYTSLPAASLFSSLGNPAINVASSKTTAVLSWKTSTADIGLWASSIKLTTTNGVVTSDFLIRVTNTPVATNKPNVSFSGDRRFNLTLGDTVSFSVSCSSEITTSLFNLSTPVLFKGETLNGGTVSVIPTTSNTPVNVVFKPVINNGGKNQQFILTFTCQNTATLSATTESVVVSVGVPLVLTIPPPAFIDCHPRCGCVDVGVATATDGCCGGPSVTFRDSVSLGSCNVKFNRTWTATNLCNQKVSIDQVITVDDKTEPYFTEVPLDTSVQCFSEIAETVATADAFDNCSRGAVVITERVETTNGTTSCNNVFSRIFTATDLCGNSISATQTITVNDIDPPFISIGTERPLKVECPSEKGFFDTIAASGDCDESHSLTFSDSADILCGKFVRTFTAVDACGNTASKDFTLEISHTEKPVITLSPPKTLTCKFEVPSVPHPTAKSFCGYNIIPTHPDPEYTDDKRCFTSATRVWTAVDECGISETVTETIQIVDDVKPKIKVPEDWTIECVYDPAQQDPYRPELTGGNATAVDNCLEDVVITYNDTLIVEACRSIIIRTWTAVDTCGNSVSADQKIFIVDTSVPEFNAPPPFNGQCAADLGFSGSVDYTGVKDCHPVKVTSDDRITVLKGDVCEDKVIIRTWTADDQCGNKAVQLQTIVIKNEATPNITVPANATIECATSPSNPEDLGFASGTDKCGNNATVNISFVDDLWTNNLGRTRVWTIIDSCGNKREESQTILYNNSMPLIQCPDNVTVPCRASSDVNLTGKATASDNCKGTLKPTFEDTESGTCPIVITRKWSVSNPVTGKSESCIQLITISHPEGPILKIHDDVNVQCEIDALTFTTTGGACSTPYCPEDVVTTPTYKDQPFGTKCNRGRYLVRTWTSNDQCGRTTNTPQTINIYDSIKPTLTVPKDVIRKCRLNLTTLEIGKATAVDNCDSNPYIFYEDSVTPSLSYCPNSVIRTWTARDCTGNFATGEQRITLDESDPVFLGNPPTELPPVQCPDDFTYPPLKAVDTCGNLLEATPRVTFSGTCPTTYTITWTATDLCGRTTHFTQTARALDTIKPVIDARFINDLTVECPANIPVTGVATVSDNCKGLITPEFEDSFPPGDCACEGCARIIQRKWTAVDKCGNQAVPVTQILTSRKTKSPTLHTPPDVTLDCGQATSADLTGTGLATATDSCGEKLYVSFKDTTTPGLSGSYLITRRWYTQDNCGHNTTSIQKIHVSPSADSIKVTPPKPCTIICGGDMSVESCGTALVQSTCGSGQTLTVVPSMEPGCPATPGVWRRKWEAYRNGIATGVVAYQSIYVQDCKPIGNGIVNVPQGQIRVTSSSPVKITAGIAITDLDLPCEIITVTWTWGDGSSNIQKCDPTEPNNDRCIFTTAGLFTSYPHSYNTAGLKNIEALVTDIRSENIMPSPIDDGPTWGRFKTRLVLVSGSGAYIAGDFYLQIAREETKKRALTQCNSNWLVAGSPSASGGFEKCSCDGEAGVLFNANFGLTSNVGVNGQIIFKIGQCCSTPINFVTNNVEHLSVFADKRSAVFVGTGTYNGNVPSTFAAFVYSAGSSSRAFYLNVKSLTGATLINTDPCFPEITDYKVRPATLPNSEFSSDLTLPSDFTVFNPVAATLSAQEEDTSSARTSTGLVVAIVSSLVVFVIIVAVILFFALRKTTEAEGSFRQM